LARWTLPLALCALALACREAAQTRPTLEVRTAPDWLALVPGDSLRLSPIVTDSQGDTLPNPSVAWQSLNPAIATVSGRGVVRGVAMGTATIRARSADASGYAGVVVAPPVLVGAGDIGVCSLEGDEATAAILDTTPGVVFTAGDNAYPDGTPGDFTRCYAPSWGRHRLRTRPTPGNHDYRVPDGAGYHAYFGPQAGLEGAGYYSWDFAGWHIIALNSNIPMAAGSPQEQWLRADLARHATRCTLAYWHHPRFSSGQHGGSTEPQPLWEALYDAGADVVIVGHDHTYERFAPQTPSGAPDRARGIRQFVAGTGGAAHYKFRGTVPNSAVRDNTSWGVLRLTLRPNGYDWKFIPVAGATFTDAGTGECH
jgi:hypothetical protein